MMDNASRSPHTHSHGYYDEDGGGFDWRSLGSISNVRKIIDVTHSFSPKRRAIGGQALINPLFSIKEKTSKT